MTARLVDRLDKKRRRFEMGRMLADLREPVVVPDPRGVG
jgi:hypothetical protein